MADIKQFVIGDFYNKIKFDITMTIEEVVAILETFQYSEADPETGLAEAILVSTMGHSQVDQGLLYAFKIPAIEGAYALSYAPSNYQAGIIVWSSGDMPEMGLVAGWQNLDENGCGELETWVPLHIENTLATNWNGTLVGADYTETVVAGTYNSSTGVWSDSASYSITDEGNNSFSATGSIPYGEADSLFPTPGYRFAVKISRSTITSRDDLDPNNVIVKITDAENQGHFFEYKAAAFESDGSLIVVFAPKSETLAIERQVQISWGGWDNSNISYVTYSFDLSGATLAPIPMNITTDICIGYCITPKIQSEKLIKVRVPEGGLYAGQLVNCVRLETEVDTLGAKLEVYVADKPTQSTVNSQFIAMISNHSGFEELEDGRRPAGQPDYTKYHYKKGDVADAVLMDKNLVFEVSTAVVSNGNPLDVKQDVGRFIIPLNGTYNGGVSDIPSEGSCLEIIGTHYFRCGNDFKPTYIARGYRQ